MPKITTKDCIKYILDYTEKNPNLFPVEKDYRDRKPNWKRMCKFNHENNILRAFQSDWSNEYTVIVREHDNKITDLFVQKERDFLNQYDMKIDTYNFTYMKNK